MQIFSDENQGSEVNAYRVFETLNARGVQLSTPDLLKNFLFAIIDQDTSTHETRIREIEDQWSRILNQLGKHDFSRFLLTEWNRRNPLARKNDLFKRIKRAITTPENAFQHLRSLDRNAEIYAALQDVRDEFWKAHGLNEAEQSLSALNLFSIVQPQGILLSAWERWEIPDFVRLLRAIEIISIRYNVICQKPAKDQEGIYNSIARDIYQGKSFEDTIQDLRKVYPSDEEFRHSFATRTFKTGKTSKKVRYLLAKIERHMNPNHPIDEAALTLEHILPEHPEEHWVEYFGEEGIDEYADRLGNMTLATSGQNSDLGQLPFEEKSAIFRASNYQISQRVARYPEWQRDQIQSRQQWLADQATAIWRISQYS